MIIDILAHPELKKYDLSSLRKGKFKFSPHNILRRGGGLPVLDQYPHSKSGESVKCEGGEGGVG